MLHVANAVEMNQRANTRDNQQHNQRQLVDLKREVDLQIAYADPVEQGGFDWLITARPETAKQRQHRQKRQYRPRNSQRPCQRRGDFSEPQAIDNKPKKGQQGNENTE